MKSNFSCAGDFPVYCDRPIDLIDVLLTLDVHLPFRFLENIFYDIRNLNA